MSFHNVRLPESIELGAVGGPSFFTSVMELYSGYEQRNINWSQTRGKWDIGYGLRSEADMKNVIDFFYARRGKAFGFRFKDWTDYQIPTLQTIATADGTRSVFQAVKTYSSGGQTFTRTLTKLVAGTVQVYEGASLASPQPTVDVDTGEITFNGPPTGGTLIGIVCEFDVPVRFDIDHLPVSAYGLELQSINGIDLVEIRV